MLLLETIKQYLLTPVCISCASYFCHDSLFCSNCFEKEIEPKINSPAASHMGNSRHYYLIDWNKDESLPIDQMIYRMKSDNSRAAWRFYAKILLQMSGVNLQKFSGFVPIPGSTPASVHSRVFAEALSAICGLPVFDILSKKVDSKAQKRGSIAERRKQNFEHRPAPQAELFTKLIFVDDVLTTGESFLQSNTAVNGHNENIILTLFYRPKAE